MILPVHAALRRHVSDILGRLYGFDASSLPELVIDETPRRELGDLAMPVAFELARRIRRPPRAIGQEVAAAFGPLAGVARVEATAAGYLNVYLDRPRFLLDRLASVVPQATVAEPGKTIVEHTAINPNKAAHIGHLRNAALGDTLVRVLRFGEVPVEIQNYIDDTGVQVADVVVGLQVLEQRNLAAVRALADSTRFDFYCWDLYARVTEWYEADRERLQLRAATLHAVEEGGNETSELARFVADRIVRRHLETMARMNVQYDLLTWEGDILRLQFWARAFEILREKRAVFLQTRGRLAGCWVMSIDESAGGDLEADTPGRAQPVAGPARTAGHESTPARETEDEADAEGDEREKVIVRSNGTVTYVGKDMAYQFWKFGLLGRDFHYRRFAPRPDGGTLWATGPEPTADDADHPPFGGASKVFNVIDIRQGYLQKLLKQALAGIGHTAEAERSIHFSYEMVALSHDTARQMGYQLSEEDAARPFVEVSGRKGLGVKADDLLDALTAKAEAEVAKRNPELPPAEQRRIGEMIGVAAVRYFMIRFSRGKVIAFDIDEALNFEGESGPYLQYAVVRAGNIFNKLRDREGQGEEEFLRGLAAIPSGELNGESGGHELWDLVLQAARLDDVVEQVVRTLEFSALAKYSFGLAQTFNAFYHRFPILNEERADLRRWRAGGVSYFRTQLARALDLMGIAVPPRM